MRKGSRIVAAALMKRTECEEDNSSVKKRDEHDENCTDLKWELTREVVLIAIKVLDHLVHALHHGLWVVGGWGRHFDLDGVVNGGF